MARGFHVGLAVLLACSCGLWAQGRAAREVARPEAPGKAAPGSRKAAPNGGVPKKVPPLRLAPPAGPIERLLAMSPEQRDRILEKMPPFRQAQLRKRFEQFDRRPPAERARLLRMWQKMENLTPERRQLLTRQMQAFNELPEERRAPVRRAFNQLSRMTPEARAERLGSDAFRNRFSAIELQMISDIAANYPFPDR